MSWPRFLDIKKQQVTLTYWGFPPPPVLSHTRIVSGLALPTPPAPGAEVSALPGAKRDGPNPEDPQRVGHPLPRTPGEQVQEDWPEEGLGGRVGF